jgi:hypothetical protein
MKARGYHDLLMVVLVPAENGAPAPRPTQTSATPWVQFP